MKAAQVLDDVGARGTEHEDESSKCRPCSDILVFSRTVLYRHESIPTAIDAIRSFGFIAEFSEDQSAFDDYEELMKFKSILFLSPSGDVLDTELQKNNLSRYIQEGGGLIGVHSATSCLRDVPTYTNTLGAILDRHSKLQKANFTVHNHSHPSTANLRPSWPVVEEVYYFQTDPRLTNVSLLLTVDPGSYNDPLKKIQTERQGGNPHPIAWCRDRRLTSQSSSEPACGRMFYTSLGHTKELWQDGDFLHHLKGGIEWVIDKS